VGTLIMLGLTIAVVSSLGAPLIPTVATSYGVTIGTAQWVLTAALLTGALATPIMGRLSDGPHQRRVILVSLVVVVCGCVLSAEANDFLGLVIGRGLQGIGLGLLPVNMAIARRELDRSTAARTIATLSVTTAIGAGLGYPLTSVVEAVWGLHASYWFGAILVGLALAVALVVLPARSIADPVRFDWLGAAMLGVVVSGVLVVLSEGESWGWTSVSSLGILGVSLGLLVLWIPWELRVNRPLVDLRHLANRSVMTADLTGFVMCVAMYLFVPIIVEFVQVPTVTGFGFGASIVVSGLALVPLSAGTFLASRFLEIYERRFGIRTMIPLGALVFSAGAVLFAFWHTSLWEAFVAVGLAGLGVGFTFAAMPGFIVRAVPHNETGSATGFYQVLRNIGLSVGSALGVAVLASHTRIGHTFPDLAGFRAALLLAGGLGVVAAVVSFVLPGSDRTIRATPFTSSHRGAARRGPTRWSAAR
jgi:MFS family permease